MAHGGSHRDLVRILLLVLYPSESSDIRRDVCLVCPVAVAGNSVHHGYEGDLRIGGETVLSRLPGRPSSAWVGAPPGADVHDIFVGVVVVPPADSCEGIPVIAKVPRPTWDHQTLLRALLAKIGRRNQSWGQQEQ